MRAVERTELVNGLTYSVWLWPINFYWWFLTDRISSSGYTGLKKNKTGKNWFLFVKKSRQIQMRQILASFSVLTRYEKFVKTNEFKFW